MTNLTPGDCLSIGKQAFGRSQGRPDMKDFKCACGKDGFVDMGEQAENRYPCKLCYYKLCKPDSAVIAMLEKEK